MLLTAMYDDGLDIVRGSLDFEVIVDDTCTDAVLSVEPAIITTPFRSYEIGQEPAIETFQASRVTSTEEICPDYYFAVTTQSNDPVDPDVF